MRHKEKRFSRNADSLFRRFVWSDRFDGWKITDNFDCGLKFLRTHAINTKIIFDTWTVHKLPLKWIKLSQVTNFESTDSFRYIFITSRKKKLFIQQWKSFYLYVEVNKRMTSSIYRCSYHSCDIPVTNAHDAVKRVLTESLSLSQFFFFHMI